ncbi:MAG: RluA family pseudouridine synthase [Rubripirellula sp.]
MATTTRSASIDESTAGRVDHMVRAFLETSHSQARGMIEHGCVSVNKVRCEEISRILAVGDEVSVRFDPTQRYREKKKKKWDDRTFTVVLEDDDLIVVDKAAGTLTVPTDHNEPNTLVERVSVYISHSRAPREACLIHRLDRDVSGLLVFGKHEMIAKLLIEQFKQKKPQRVYTAIVAGLVREDSGTFKSELATGKNLDRYSAPASRNTETAITHFRVIKRLSDATHVEVTLETGRRNQIRVHFADAGHPVLGDPRYGKELAEHPRWKRKRIALHAASLGFVHPVSEQPVLVESPLPPALAKFLASDRPQRKEDGAKKKGAWPSPKGS